MGRYEQLCPVYFGNGAAASAGEVANALGVNKALVVTDQTIYAAGRPQKVISSLEQAGIEVEVYDEVEMDAPDYTVEEGAKLAVKFGADCIVGCGGGSAMDTAKGISLFATNIDDLTIQKLIRFNPENPLVLKPGLKNIMIPTTSGTGSESTFVAVITDTMTHNKCGCLVTANAAIVDPELTYGLDKLITAYTGMDAFSHCNEALCNQMANPHSDTLAINAMQRIVEWLPTAIEDPENVQARYELAVASNFAGIAFQDSQVNVGHAMAHGLGARLHIPHGICCALITPVVIELVASARPDMYRKVAELFSVDSSDDKELGLKLADAVRSFVNLLGIPSFKEQGFTRDQITDTVDYAEGEMMRMGCIVPQDSDMLADMLGRAYDLY